MFREYTMDLADSDAVAVRTGSDTLVVYAGRLSGRERRVLRKHVLATLGEEGPSVTVSVPAGWAAQAVAARASRAPLTGGTILASLGAAAVLAVLVAAAIVLLVMPQDDDLAAAPTGEIPALPASTDSGDPAGTVTPPEQVSDPAVDRTMTAGQQPPASALGAIQAPAAGAPALAPALAPAENAPRPMNQAGPPVGSPESPTGEPPDASRGGAVEPPSPPEEAPRGDLPDLPERPDVPDVDLPDVPDVDLPDVDVPDVPDVDVPDVPDVDVPDVDVPDVDVEDGRDEAEDEGDDEQDEDEGDGEQAEAEDQGDEEDQTNG